MNDFVRRQLIELVAEQGSSIADDARRCEAFLNDRCRNERKREIFVLVNAIVRRIPADLRATSVPGDVLFVRLTNRLVQDLGVNQRLAAWAVSSWAVALGVSGAESWGSAWQSNSDNPFEEETSLSAVEMLRQAVRKALEDNIVTDEERDELRTLARTLGVAPELAAHIFTEELERHRNPPSPQPAAPQPQSPQPTGPAPPTPQHPGPQSPTPQPPPKPPLPQPPRKHVHPALWAFITVAVAAVVAIFIFPFGIKPPRSSTPSPVETRYATRPASVRDKATTVDSKVERKLTRGDSVSGSWLAPDNVHRWLQIGEGQFVSEVNLSDRPRPKIVRMIDTDEALTQPSLLYKEADGAAGSIEEMQAGESVHAYAEVEGGWVEIQRISGGVGYVPSLVLPKQAVNQVDGCVPTAELYRRTICGNAGLSALDRSMKLAYGNFIVHTDANGLSQGDAYRQEAETRQRSCGSDANCLTLVLINAKQYYASHATAE